MGELMTSRWETWELHQVHVVDNYFYFIEIHLLIQLSKTIHELPFPSPVFSSPNVSPPLALMNLILMVCGHL